MDKTNSKEVVVEIEIDAKCEYLIEMYRSALIPSTVSMNSKNFELHSIMAEHDGASFSLDYCFLLTVSAIDVHKK